MGATVRVKTGSDGRFSIPKLGDFEFVVTAKGGGYGPVRVPGTVRVGDELELHLQQPQRLTGQIVRASEPVAGQTLWILHEDAGFEGWHVLSDDDGKFSVSGLPPGMVRFVIDTVDGHESVGRATVPAQDVLIRLPVR